MSEYFSEPKSSRGKVKVELDLSSYATKTDLKNATGDDTSSFAKKTDLASLKSDVDKLDIDKFKNVPTNLSSLKSKADELDKLVPVPVDLSKLRDVVKNDVVKKDVYNDKIKNIEDKIPGITNLGTKTTLSAAINKVAGEIPNVNNLAATSVLTSIENKIPSVSNLVKKAGYNIKISKIEKKITDHNHDKYITIPEFNKFTVEIFDLRLKQANLASESDIANFVKKTDFDNKLKDVTSYKNELNELSKKVKAISTKGLRKDLINKFSILKEAKYFSSEIFQNYLVFIPANKYFTGTIRIES